MPHSFTGTLMQGADQTEYLCFFIYTWVKSALSSSKLVSKY